MFHRFHLTFKGTQRGQSWGPCQTALSSIPGARATTPTARTSLRPVLGAYWLLPCGWGAAQEPSCTDSGLEGHREGVPVEAGGWDGIPTAACYWGMTYK